MKTTTSSSCREETAKARGFSSLAKCMKIVSSYRNSTNSSSSTTAHPLHHRYSSINRSSRTTATAPSRRVDSSSTTLPPLFADRHWRQPHDPMTPQDQEQPILQAASFLQHLSTTTATTSRADPEPIKSVVALPPRRSASAARRGIGESGEVINGVLLGNKKLMYDCKDCDRSFTSFQALGGHRASHTKPRGLDGDQNSDGMTKFHQCMICGQEFQIGQALGGHMRKHREFLSAARSASASASTTTSYSTTPTPSQSPPPPPSPSSSSTPSPSPPLQFFPTHDHEETPAATSNGNGKRGFDFDLNLPYEEETEDDDLELRLKAAA